MSSAEPTPAAPLDFWIPDNDPSVIDCLCLGTGRFLRAVLVPALVASGFHPSLIQPRGASFVSFLRDEQGSYPVHTVTPTGDIETARIKCHGAFTMGSQAGKQTLRATLPKMKGVGIIGVGVTEAGLASHETQAMQDLYLLLAVTCELQTNGVWSSARKLIVLDMDNVPNNGVVIRQHMLELAKRNADSSQAMVDFLTNRVAFLNTMVDRITSQRPNSDGMVPLCEPLPAKALVICDDENYLPELIVQNQAMLKRDFGVVIRKTAQELHNDIALKLRIANGTHTALAHAMALCRLFNTDVLTSSSAAVDLLLLFLDALVKDQILRAANILLSSSSQDAALAVEDDETNEALATWLDWKKRLLHPKFGLSTLFITQNGAQKGGIRWGPTVVNLIEEHDRKLTSSSAYHDSMSPITVSMCFAFAALLRFLTPISTNAVQKTDKGTTYQGWFDLAVDRKSMALLKDASEGTVYADGLAHNDQCYEFRNSCLVANNGRNVNLSDWLAQLSSPHPQQPVAYWNVIREYLKSPEGGNLGMLTSDQLEPMVQAIATMYARMVVGDGLMKLLQEMKSPSALLPKGLATSCSTFLTSSDGVVGHLHYCANPIPNDSGLMTLKIVGRSSSPEDDAKFLSSIVTAEVQGALVIDLHTHLLPPAHGALCLWGIDELLTYHYLVAEYFMTAPPSVNPQEFYSLSKHKQADLIWNALFLQRSPVSEACRGVITTLCTLGLTKEVEARDLDAIRQFYSTFRDEPQGVEQFSEMIFTKAGVKYAVMTNIPFEEAEARHWKPQRTAFSERYRSAIRVDPLLAGDRATVEAALKAAGYDSTLDGARQFLRDWCDAMHPEYMMASTPHDFVVPEGSISGIRKTGVNEEAMKQPFAFVEVSQTPTNRCDSTEDDAPSVIDENSDFLTEVLMKVCEERDLPLALKIGAHRGVNPALGAAGDGVVAFADSGMLSRLCTRFPKVRFLATFLSRNNQHEACVLASKFRNLHIYGCWWYSNIPSLIQEITKMRVEMLGTAFTAQHSDARVLDQLVYKWSHSRDVISHVLRNEYKKLMDSGWTPTRSELRRDINRLFGGSYEEFMSKSLQNLENK